MLSAAKEIEPRTRAMILLADGLFRFDVAIVSDTLRTTVRNLSAGELTIIGDDAGFAGESFASGDVARYQPTRSPTTFALRSGNDQVIVEILLATLRFTDRGLYRVSAQAIVRQIGRLG